MKQTLILMILVILTGGSFWLLRDLERTLVPQESAKPTREIAVAYRVNGRYYNAENQLQYSLDSDTVTEFSNLAGTRLTNPAVSVLETTENSQRLAWQGQATDAHLSGDKNLLTMTGNVTLIESPTTAKPIYARSETMVYNAQTQRVSSDVKVTLNSDTMQQSAASFWLDIPTRTVGFQGGVKANYQPRQPLTPE